MQILEFFHCGPDRHATLYPIEHLSADAIETVLLLSPNTNVKTNPDGPACVGNLMNQREGEMGWCRYWIVPSVGDTVEMTLYSLGNRENVITGTVVEERQISDRTTPTWMVDVPHMGKVMWSTGNSAPKHVIVN